MTTKARPLPSQEYLNSVLDYCPETGVLTWKHRNERHFKSSGAFKTWNTRFSGRAAGSPHGQGYRQINLDGKVYLAHRVIWTMVHGDFGTDDIDHINGNRSDNRLENLRSVSRTVNLRNAATKGVGATGVCGVSLHRSTGKYRAYVGINGKQVHLGFFDDVDSAIAARSKANETYGFTDRHGV